ncbi:hypothetical protein Unana1_08633 [Umbelopsis nana]
MLRIQFARAQLSKLTATTTTQVRALTAFSNMSDNNPKVLEEEKKKHLEKPVERQWDEKLATHSEADVKADQSEDKPINRLQQESVEDLKKQKD